MAESFTSYSVDNDKKFRDAVKRAGDVSQDLRIPFSLILSDFYRKNQAIFINKGPGKYPPFYGKKSPKTGLTKYQAYKRKKYGHDYPLLVATGSLANSLLGPSNRGSVSKVSKLSLTFGTSIEYGLYHQKDEPKNRTRPPMRKFLFIGPEGQAPDDQKGNLQRWFGYMESHIAREMKKQGLG